MNTQSNTDTAIHARGLRVRRGSREVLQGVDLDIARCQVTGLLGPSGSGKSTLLRAIVGVQANVSGTIEVLSQAPGSRGLRRRVSYATQAASVYDDLTVQQNLRYLRRCWVWERAKPLACSNAWVWPNTRTSASLT